MAMLAAPFFASADSDKEWSEEEKALLCKNYIGEIFGKPVSIIDHYKTDEGGRVYVKYIRKADNQEWRYACAVHPDNIIWSGWLDYEKKWGRWRNEDRVTLDYNSTQNTVYFKHPHHDAVTVNLD